MSDWLNPIDGGSVGDLTYPLTDQQMRYDKYLKINISEKVAIDRASNVFDCYQDACMDGSIKKIGQSASRNAFEFFAEIFCMYMMNDKQLPDKLRDLIDEVFK